MPVELTLHINNETDKNAYMEIELSVPEVCKSLRFGQRHSSLTEKSNSKIK